MKHLNYRGSSLHLRFFVFSLCMTSYDLGEMGQGQADVPAWVDMMLHFRVAANRTYGINRPVQIYVLSDKANS